MRPPDLLQAKFGLPFYSIEKAIFLRKIRTFLNRSLVEGSRELVSVKSFPQEGSFELASRARTARILRVRITRPLGFLKASMPYGVAVAGA